MPKAQREKPLRWSVSQANAQILYSLRSVGIRFGIEKKYRFVGNELAAGGISCMIEPPRCVTERKLDLNVASATGLCEAGPFLAVARWIAIQAASENCTEPSHLHERRPAWQARMARHNQYFRFHRRARSFARGGSCRQSLATDDLPLNGSSVHFAGKRQPRERLRTENSTILSHHQTAALSAA